MNVTLKPSDVSVIILNYCNAKDTILCLKSIYSLDERPKHIIVVDNNSSDDSLAAILSAWPTPDVPQVIDDRLKQSPSPTSAMLIAKSSNDGFSAGNNSGICLALKDIACRAIWVLNNDTEPTSDSLGELCKHMNQRPEAGLCGSTLVFYDDSTIVQCAAGASLSLLTGRTRFLCNFENTNDVCAMPALDIEARLGEITGASMLIRREVFGKVGFFDERYFLYREDSEWSLRCRAAGYSLAWAPKSIVLHKEGGSTGARSYRVDAKNGKMQAPVTPPYVDYLSQRNKVFLIRTYSPWALPIVLLSFGGVLLKRILRKQYSRLFIVLRAFWDGLFGHMGRPYLLDSSKRDVEIS